MQATLLVQRCSGSHISKVVSSEIQQATLNLTNCGHRDVQPVAQYHSDVPYVQTLDKPQYVLVYRRHDRNIKIIFYIFVNCNWVVTRWQYTFAHRQCIERYKTNNTQNNITILEECEPCPVLASITQAFALQPRKKHGKTSVRVAASKNTQTTISIHRQQ